MNLNICHKYLSLTDAKVVYIGSCVCVKNTTRNIQSRKQSENVDRVFNAMVIPGANHMYLSMLIEHVFIFTNSMARVCISNI